MTILDTDPQAETAPTAPVPPERRRRRRWKLVLAIILVALAPVGWSYGRALTRPGTDGLGVRSVEWIRDHGGSRLVAWVETEWYSHHAPPKGGVPKALPTVVSPVTATPRVASAAPRPITPIASPPVFAEGVWQPAGRAVDGTPVLYTTFMRPDAVHTSLVTGLAWIDPARVRFTLFSGTQEPGGAGWQRQAPVPDGQRSSLVAAFNSGFKLADSRGGYYAEGRTVRPLIDGRASMVFYNDGRFDVGMWGRDFVMSPAVSAVRQNLLLLIDHGRPAPNLDHASQAEWGWTVANKILVWRSGVGVDAEGHVIYAAGNGLSVQSLANVLLAAGAVRAMELDINSAWTHFFSYHNDATVAGGTSGSKLLPDMTAPVDKYFRPSTRDFIAVFADPTPQTQWRHYDW